MLRVAVEEPLTDVMQELNKQGYNAEILDRKVEAASYDCVVVRDKEDLADLHMNVPLVEAKGRSVNEIVDKVGEHLERAGKKAPSEKKQAASSGKRFLSGMALGTIVGAATGFLTAPTEGKKLRSKITSTTSQTKEKTSGIMNKAKNKKSGGKKNEDTTELAPKEEVEVKPEPTNQNADRPATTDTERPGTPKTDRP